MNVTDIREARRARLNKRTAALVSENVDLGLRLSLGYSPSVRPQVLEAVLACCPEPLATRKALRDLSEDV